MFARWRHHLLAVAILAATGSWTIFVPPWAAGPDQRRMLPFLMPEQVPGTLGTRFFGYGALVLLALALAMGPLARLRPRPFARLIPYRRAVGVWSAIAGVVHLLFVLQMVSWEFYDRNWWSLFVKKHTFLWPGSPPVVDYRLPLDALSTVAWLGFFGLVLLLLVALVSNDRAQRFLGQATWKLVQQWTYTAFLFVTLHLLVMRWGGKLKLSPPLTRWAFWLLGATALLQMAGFLHTVWKRRGRGSADHAA